MLNPRSPGPAIDRHPDLERVLRREAVKAQRRQQADYTAGHATRGLRQMMSLSSRAAGESVQAATDALDQASHEQSPELGPGDSGALQIPRAGDAQSLQHLLRLFRRGYSCHNSSNSINKCQGNVTCLWK